MKDPFMHMNKIGLLLGMALIAHCCALKTCGAEVDRVDDGASRVLTTFRMERTDQGVCLTNGKTILKNQNEKPGLPYIFSLPDEWCDNRDFNYEVRAEVTPAWKTAHPSGFHTLFALNSNVMGQQTHSSTLTFLEGQVLARVIGRALGNTAEIRTPLSVVSGRTYVLQSRFSANNLELSVNDKAHGPCRILREFSWPRGARFLVGAEGPQTSLLQGEIRSFSLRVLTDNLRAGFVGNDFGYWYGSGEHAFHLAFPLLDGSMCDSTVAVNDPDGKTLATLAPFNKSDAEHTYTLPTLPFGAYSLAVRVSRDGASKRFQRSVALMPATVKREPADRSSFGMTTEWPLSREQANPKLTDASFAKMAEMGVRWFRLWLSWSDIEEERGRYYFDGMDTVVAQAKKYGISLVVTLYGGTRHPFQSVRPADPQTARLATPHFALPSDMQIWTQYVTAVAQRYKGSIQHYQIWNENDTRWFIYPFSAEAYLDILKRSAEALRAVDPGVIIHWGGHCAGYKPEWIHHAKRAPDANVIGLAEFYNLQPQAYFDISDYHFYTTDMPGQDWDGFVPQVTALKKFLAERGDGKKPLWDSETGITSTPDPKRAGEAGGLANVPLLSERMHAVRMVTRQVQELSLGVAVVIHYHLLESGGFGVVHDDFSPKPAIPAMVNLANRLYGRTFRRQILLDKPNLRAYQFTGGGASLTVLWTVVGTETIPVRRGKAATVALIDLMGNAVALQESVTVGMEPVYMESTDGSGLVE